MSDITTDFIKATNRIYAKVAAILVHLQIIEGDVKLIREQPVRDTRQPQPDTDARNSENQPEASIRAPSSVKGGQSSRYKNESNDDSYSGFYRFKQRWKKSLRKPIVQLEIAALIGLSIYTCETRRTNNLTEKGMKFQFSLARSQGRSYLQVDFTPFNQSKLEEIQKLGFDLGLKNLGKITASKIKGAAVMEVPLAMQPPSLNYRTAHSEGIAAPLAPGGATTILALVPLANGLDAQLMTESLRDDLRDGKNYMVIFGRIEYEDAFGQWWQNFCGWKAFSKQSSVFNASSCVEFNTEGGIPKTFSTDD